MASRIYFWHVLCFYLAIMSSTFAGKLSKVFKHVQFLNMSKWHLLNNKDTNTTFMDVSLMSLLLTLNGYLCTVYIGTGDKEGKFPYNYSAESQQTFTSLK